MVKALAESGLARYEPYAGVRLTAAGAKLAALVLRRHRLVELFLVQVMGMSWTEVHDEAENLEHAVSDRLIERMDKSQVHPDVIVNEVFEATVEEHLKNPTFVIDYPASICPLTKRKAGVPNVAERFELFIQGMEIANAYTELNDPDLQEQLFKTQLAGQAEEESMAKMDHDFIEALKHGMPPAGGLGLGIDRLVMLLTNSPSIRDVILFPLLRPEG